MLLVFSGIGLVVSVDLGFRNRFVSRWRWGISKVVGMVAPDRMLFVVVLVILVLVAHQVLVAIRLIALNRGDHAVVALVTGTAVGGGFRHGMNRRIDGREGHVGNRGRRRGWIVRVGAGSRLRLLRLRRRRLLLLVLLLLRFVGHTTAAVLECRGARVHAAKSLQGFLKPQLVGS